MSGWIDRPGLLDSAAALAEETRCRLLAILDAAELTVGECCQVLQLPQSTVSRHLKVLLTAGWLRQRTEGRRNLYRFDAAAEGPEARLWRLFADELATLATFAEDGRRLEAVLQARRESSARFFSVAASDWDDLRDRLFGSDLDRLALLAALEPSAVVADLGCGTGRLAAALAPWVAEVVAIDGSTAMLDAARQRTEGLGRVRCELAELEELPLGDATVDLAFCVLALHHAPRPERVLAEAHRILRPAGRLILLDMLPHDREAWRVEMGHQWLGFEPSQLEARLAALDFEAISSQVLAADPEASGPSLFLIRGHRPRAVHLLTPSAEPNRADRRQERR